MNCGDPICVTRVPPLYRRELKKGQQGTFLRSTTDVLSGELHWIKFEGWHTHFALRADEFQPLISEEIETYDGTTCNP